MLAVPCVAGVAGSLCVPAESCSLELLGVSYSLGVPGEPGLSGSLLVREVPEVPGSLGEPGVPEVSDSLGASVVAVVPVPLPGVAGV
jgi:hypothetical protein